MKALTIKQPWAIVHSTKQVENRTWAPPSRIIGERLGTTKQHIDLCGRPLERARKAAAGRGDRGG